MTGARLILALALSGCYSPVSEKSCTISCGAAQACDPGFECMNNVCALPGDTCSTDMTDGGAGVDVPGVPCYGHGVAPFLRVCPAFPLADQMTIITEINTNTGCEAMHPQTGGPDLCVIAATTMVIPNAVRVVGTRPLLLLGTQSVTIGTAGIGGLLDASGRVGAPMAAGATGVGCGISNGAGNQSGSGGGGAGGTLGGEGGSGGAGNGASGGVAETSAQIAIVRGGCPGGAGGGGGAASGGTGGVAGGAIYVMSGGEIRIEGTINVSGSAGGRPGTLSGGGGGGSGGMVVLDGTLVKFGSGGSVFALGGGGASGGGSTAGVEGAYPLGVMMYAGSTLAAEPDAGDGGAGGDPLAAETGLAGASGGGGGGGGGGGMIRIWPAPGGVTPVDPPAS